MRTLTDQHGRVVQYLRISITDRCNLRCNYCITDPGFSFIPHDKILSYEEITAILVAACATGADKVRFTGGEPFARKDFVPFLKHTKQKFPSLDIRITTNATLLGPHLQGLVESGITSLNISLDSFNPVIFQTITGKDLFAQAYANILNAIDAGIRVKINCVALKGVNDTELESFIAFAATHNVDVRFIELMPLGGRRGWSNEQLWRADDIIAEANKFVTLLPIRANKANTGPARMYSIAGSKGRLGVISPLTNHFCDTCNRIRITSEGKLRTCLFSDEEYSIKELLNDPSKGPDDLIALFQEKLSHKPIGVDLLNTRQNMQRVIFRDMSSIGG